MTFARKLQIGMAITDIKPKELAKATNYSISSVYEWLEGNRIPHAKNRVEIMNCLERKRSNVLWLLEVLERWGVE